MGKAYATGDEQGDELLLAKEGEVSYRLHKHRERDPRLAKRKKAKALKELGKLACEVCDFDFMQKYGALGEGFIECHHKTPLAELDASTETSLDDLALVCANCHRMLHRSAEGLSVDELKKRIQE